MSKLAFTLIQTDLYWEDKEANLEVLDKKIDAIPAGTHITVLPEMFSTGFSMQTKQLAETMEGPTVQWMKKKARDKKMILAGSVIIDEEGKYYNRLIWMLPNEQYGYYDKRHLFAYAHEHEHFTPGSQRLIASVNGWKINMMVCYDLRFPVWSRQSPSFIAQEQLEYDVLIYIANWPEKRNIAWKTLLQARAIENQCYVIGVNRVGKDGNDIYYSGDSMVIDPLGEILYHKDHEEDVFTIPLDKEHVMNVRQRFPFWKDADGFEIYT